MQIIHTCNSKGRIPATCKWIGTCEQESQSECFQGKSFLHLNPVFTLRCSKDKKTLSYLCGLVSHTGSSLSVIIPRPLPSEVRSSERIQRRGAANDAGRAWGRGSWFVCWSKNIWLQRNQERELIHSNSLQEIISNGTMLLRTQQDAFNMKIKFAFPGSILFE